MPNFPKRLSLDIYALVILPRVLIVFAIAALLGSTGCGQHGWTVISQSRPGALISYQEYRMPNGLRVIQAPDRMSPLVAVNVTYDVGSRDEVPGKSGLAHFCEHMMFKGSPRVAAGEHFALINGVGGSADAYTYQDRTTFSETLPANQLPLALFLEADRMHGIDIRPDHLEQVRQEVMEEKREDHDDLPYDAATSACSAVSYTKFAYQHKPIGTNADLSSITTDDVRGFVEKYYRPNEAVLVICGNFDVRAARSVIDRDFGDIPSGPDVAEPDNTEPLPHSRSEKYVDDEFARREMYARGYITVGETDPDFMALDMLAVILCHGEDSPLQNALVNQFGASDVWASISAHPTGSLFEITYKRPCNYANANDFREARTAIDSAVARIRDEGVTDDQMCRADAYVQTSTLADIQTRSGRAALLAQYAIQEHDPNRINTFIDRALKVRPEDIQRVCRRYLDPVSMCEVYSGPNDLWANPTNSDPPIPAVHLARQETPPAGSSTIDLPKHLAPIDSQNDIPSLPQPETMTLPNGLRLILSEDHHIPLVGAYAYTGAGEVDQNRPGIAVMTLEAECADTIGQSPKAFRASVERNGLDIKPEIYTDYARLCVGGKSDKIHRIVSTLSDILQRPTFDPTEVDRIGISEMSERLDSEYDSRHMFYNIGLGCLGRGTPYSLPLSNWRDIYHVNRADMIAFWSKNVRANRTIIVMVGDFDSKTVKSMLTAEFKNWTPGKPWTPVPAPVGGIRAPMTVVNWRRGRIAMFEVSSRVPGLLDKGHAAFAVLDTILARSSSSRLFRALRGRNGDAYAASSTITDFRSWSKWTFYTAVEASKTDEFYSKLYDEVAEIRSQPVTREELESAKRELIGRLTISWESPVTQATYESASELKHLPPKFWSQYIAAIQAVTPIDIYQSAARYLSDDNLCVVAIGPAHVIAPTLSRYGQVKILDYRGQPSTGPN
jgi:predicted Zn-dependent peptidase